MQPFAQKRRCEKRISGQREEVLRLAVGDDFDLAFAAQLFAQPAHERGDDGELRAEVASVDDVHAELGGALRILGDGTVDALTGSIAEFTSASGSLTLGGIIAVCAILTHKELLLPILCALFYIEDLSVILQVAYYKHTGGKRIFKMSPLHHHFQKPGNAGYEALIQRPIQPIPEAEIVTRFWIIGIILAVVTFVTLKIR